MYTIKPLHFRAPNWDLVFRTIENADEEIQKKIAWKRSAEFLYAELGKGFFDTCGYNHPISLKLTTNISQIDELIEFTNILRRFKETDPSNYSVLVEKLKPRKKCQFEGIPFYDILKMFGCQGFAVKFLKEIEGQRNPDIELRDNVTGESVFVEVSQLQQSIAQKSIQDQHRLICDTFLLSGLDLPQSFKQLRHIEGDEMKRILAHIKLMKEQAANNRKFVSFENEYIRMAVAHPDSLNELDEWCAKHSMQRNGMEGLSVDFNDTRRLVGNNKIVSEIKQLPKGLPGFVYIPVSFLYFLSMDLADTVISITQQLLNYPNCMGVLLYAPSCGTLLPLETKDVLNVRRSIRVENGITRHLLFIGNPSFESPLSKETQNKFQKCIR